MIPDDKTKHAFDGWFHAYFDNLHGRPGPGWVHRLGTILAALHGSFVLSRCEERRIAFGPA
jgi:hypothetical protein